VRIEGIALLLLGAVLLCCGVFMLARPRTYQRYLTRNFERRSWLRRMWREWAFDYLSSPGYLLQILLIAPFAIAFGLLTLWGGGSMLGFW
jgi:hypothetical protein